MAAGQYSDDGPRVVLGLGNPGPKYEATRHNLGFMVTGELADRHGLRLSRSGHRSLWDKGMVLGQKVIVAQPQTYMNLSGQAAQAVLAYFGLEPEALIVVHDDLDLPLGRLKVALKGRPGGHRGVADIIACLGDERFTRLKVGIGRPRYGEDSKKYVLESFYADQHELVGQMVQTAADCLETILAEGAQAAMQKFHRSIIKEEVEG